MLSKDLQDSHMGHLDFILTYFKHGCSALGRKATRAARPSETAFPSCSVFLSTQVRGGTDKGKELSDGKVSLEELGECQDQN